MSLVAGVEIAAPVDGRLEAVLTPEALCFVAELERRFGPQREDCLRRRAERQARLDAGERLDFLPATRHVREGDWRVGPVPADLQDRRVEITGPTDRKMVINALSSGARGFMADFEDSNSPTWRNMAGGQLNLIDAVTGTIDYTAPDGREYRLPGQTATLLVRPRGWHLPERHIRLDGRPVAGALFDAGLFLFHNARRLLERGSGPYLYLPKLESHLEARLWKDVLRFAERELGLAPGTVKVTVLIETLPAAFAMEEILYELREHAVGLNAGRWDYMFSMIKCHRERPDMVLPDRVEVTMTVAFMRAYTELLVRTCHRRGAHAMGGMAAMIPSRTDAQANERALAGVREDKRREAADGFDGTWIAHPDLVGTATEEFDAILGDRPNQVERQREDVDVGADELLDAASAGREITEAGLRNDVNVGIQYVSSWLRGNGAAGIYGLMEDAATAEIARSQVWQWVRHGARLIDGGGGPVTPDLVRRTEAEELARIRAEIGDDEWFAEHGRPELSRELFEQVALSDELTPFLTLPAYERLEEPVEPGHHAPRD